MNSSSNDHSDSCATTTTTVVMPLPARVLAMQTSKCPSLQGCLVDSCNQGISKLRGPFGGVPIIRNIIGVHIGIPPFMETTPYRRTSTHEDKKNTSTTVRAITLRKLAFLHKRSCSHLHVQAVDLFQVIFWGLHRVQQHRSILRLTGVSNSIILIGGEHGRALNISAPSLGTLAVLSRLQFQRMAASGAIALLTIKAQRNLSRKGLLASLMLRGNAFDEVPPIT